MTVSAGDLECTSGSFNWLGVETAEGPQGFGGRCLILILVHKRVVGWVVDRIYEEDQQEGSLFSAIKTGGILGGNMQPGTLASFTLLAPPLIKRLVTFSTVGLKRWWGVSTSTILSWSKSVGDLPSKLPQTGFHNVLLVRLEVALHHFIILHRLYSVISQLWVALHLWSPTRTIEMRALKYYPCNPGRTARSATKPRATRPYQATADMFDCLFAL